MAKPTSKENFSISALFKKSRRSAVYWLERIELCENKAQRKSLAKEIAKLERESQDK